jgi:hypothetical protein
METKIVSNIGSFAIGEKMYFFKGVPIEAHYYFCNKNDTAGGWWTGIDNKGPITEPVAVPNIDVAFNYLKERQKNDERYLGGIVLDFSTDTLYFDNEQMDRYWKTRPEEKAVFKNHVKVSNW